MNQISIFLLLILKIIIKEEVYVILNIMEYLFIYQLIFMSVLYDIFHSIYYFTKIYNFKNKTCLMEYILMLLYLILFNINHIL